MIPHLSGGVLWPVCEHVIQILGASSIVLQDLKKLIDAMHYLFKMSDYLG